MFKQEVLGYKQLFNEYNNLPMCCYGVMSEEYMHFVVDVNFKAGYKTRIRPIYKEPELIEQFITVVPKKRETGIPDKHGNIIHEGDLVVFSDDSEPLHVVWIGEGDEMDWAADNLDDTPNTWLDSHCEIVEKGGAYEYCK